jgi:hypothetical protein
MYEIHILIKEPDAYAMRAKKSIIPPDLYKVFVTKGGADGVIVRLEYPIL